MPDKPATPFANTALAREAVRVVLAISAAAGTAYTSMRSALNNHESRIGLLESEQSATQDKLVGRQELDAHWSAISEQLAQIEQDLRDLRNDQRQTRDLPR
jgi:hypothetical protein